MQFPFFQISYTIASLIFPQKHILRLGPVLRAFCRSLQMRGCPWYWHSRKLLWMQDMTLRERETLLQLQQLVHPLELVLAL